MRKRVYGLGAVGILATLLVAPAVNAQDGGTPIQLPIEGVQFRLVPSPAADSAKPKTDSAKSKNDSAKAKSEAVKSKADSAKAKADSGKAKAKAKAKAVPAKTKADSAKAKADSAKAAGAKPKCSDPAMVAAVEKIQSDIMSAMGQGDGSGSASVSVEPPAGIAVEDVIACMQGVEP